MPRTALTIATALLLALAGCSSSEAPAVQAEPSNSAAAPSFTAGELRYIAAVRQVHPHLAARPERTVRRGHGVCDYVSDPTRTRRQRLYYVRTMLSGGDYQMTRAEALKVIALARVNLCPEPAA